MNSSSVSSGSMNGLDLLSHAAEAASSAKSSNGQYNTITRDGIPQSTSDKALLRLSESERPFTFSCNSAIRPFVFEGVNIGFLPKKVLEEIQHRSYELTLGDSKHKTAMPTSWETLLRETEPNLSP